MAKFTDGKVENKQTVLFVFRTLPLKLVSDNFCEMGNERKYRLYKKFLKM